MNSLLLYTAIQYGIKAGTSIVNTYVENYPYMSGYGIALIFPGQGNRVPPGLISNIINGGAIIRG